MGGQVTSQISSNISQALNGRIMAPIFMINGFYVKGQSLSYNVGGTNGRKDLKNYYLAVQDAVGDVVGCTANMLM